MRTEAKRPRATRKLTVVAAAAAPAAEPWKAAWWIYALGAAAAFLCAYWAYTPALQGEFVFDDLHLPFTQPGAIIYPLRDWLHVRPVTMFTYWANLHLFGLRPYSYHLWNVLFHTAAAVLLYFIVRRTLALAQMGEADRQLFSLFAGAVFLLHPIQSEGVAYVAGRSEDLSAILFFAAWCVFLYRRDAVVSWVRAAAILLLFGAAVASKEHTVTLPAVLLLTDYYFNPGFSWKGAIRNWRLYLPIAIGGLAGAVVILKYIGGDTLSIGFNIKEFTWYQYLFTQFRVFFAYIRLFVLPVGQTADYDFPVSRTLFDHGAIFALLGILILAALAFHYRRRFPLASYGFFLFGLMLAPTSSVIPIKDVIAERRLYLPIVGLLLITIDFARRWKADRKLVGAALAGTCLILAAGTYHRSQVWSTSLGLWLDTAEKAPHKERTVFGTAVASFQAHQCKQAIDYFERAAAIEKPDYMVTMDWGMAYDCLGQFDLAHAKLQESIRQKPSAEAWANDALVGLHQGQVDAPLAALAQAQAIDPRYVNTYLYRGSLEMALEKFPDAEANFRQALIFQPANQAVLDALARLRALESQHAR